MKTKKSYYIPLIIVLLLIILYPTSAYAQPGDFTIPSIGIEVGEAHTPRDLVNTFEILFVFTILTLAPSILIMMTSFTRIIIVLSFMRNALGTQQTPPNQVLIGLAIFLTIFVMAPIGEDINTNAIQPYINETIDQEQALEYAMKPLREFMLKQTRNKDLSLFVNLSNMDAFETLDEIPNRVIIPAFMISELKTAFQIGFLLFIPFIIIDMVVASTLMSMGMMMLPPVIISLPFKILLFIMVDGWNLIVKTIITNFQ
ncbi:MAG: flagellar type III secretion system pore protein FliP [Clostridiales bacterium]|nr:flagellar type III secretion system pore protein FliP [Clostridiales bacterium]